MKNHGYSIIEIIIVVAIIGILGALAVPYFLKDETETSRPTTDTPEMEQVIQKSFTPFTTPLSYDQAITRDGKTPYRLDHKKQHEKKDVVVYLIESPTGNNFNMFDYELPGLDLLEDGQFFHVTPENEVIPLAPEDVKVPTLITEMIATKDR